MDLDFEVAYFLDDGLVTRELYHSSPFEIVFDTAVSQSTNLKYTIVILNKNEFKIETEGEMAKKYNYANRKFDAGVLMEKFEWKKNYRFGDLIENPYNSFKVVLNNRFDPETDIDKTYKFVFSDYFSLAGQFGGTEIEPVSRESSILEIKFKHANAEKATAYLNMLTMVYLQQSLEMKNKIAENTIRFINNQLSEISDTLKLAEVDLQNFQSSREVMDIDYQAQQVITSLKELEDQKAILIVNSNYYKNLKDYIVSKQGDMNNLVAPTAMGIEDQVLNRLVGELITLYNTKAEQLLYSTDKSPTVIAINNHIVNTKNAILENINNIIYNSDQTIREIDKRINTFTQKVSYLPVTQRELINFERRFTLADNIYTYLLQKRTEAQITKASNLPDNEVVDIARAELSDNVFPKKTLNYLIAFVLGLAFPVAYVLLKDFLNYLARTPCIYF